jgi:hypothetical protein
LADCFPVSLEEFDYSDTPATTHRYVAEEGGFMALRVFPQNETIKVRMQELQPFLTHKSGEVSCLNFGGMGNEVDLFLI